MENNCENCAFLNIINRKPVYAYCLRNRWVFELWDVDCRKTICGNHIRDKHKRLKIY